MTTHNSACALKGLSVIISYTLKKKNTFYMKNSYSVTDNYAVSWRQGRRALKFRLVLIKLDPFWPLAGDSATVGFPNGST